MGKYTQPHTEYDGKRWHTCYWAIVFYMAILVAGFQLCWVEEVRAEEQITVESLVESQCNTLGKQTLFYRSLIIQMHDQGLDVSKHIILYNADVYYYWDYCDTYGNDQVTFIPNLDGDES